MQCLYQAGPLKESKTSGTRKAPDLDGVGKEISPARSGTGGKQVLSDLQGIDRAAGVIFIKCVPCSDTYNVGRNSLFLYR